MVVALRAAPLAALLGCATVERIEETQLAGACVDGVDVVATFSTCLSSSCDTVIEASCAARLDAGEVVLTGAAVIDAQVGGACTTDCVQVTARCPLPEQAAASTTLRWSGGEGVIRELACP